MILLMDELLPFKREINQKEFQAGRVCQSRWLKYWEGKGLFFNSVTVKENKWTMYTFCEIIWAKAIVKMRQYGVAIEDIKKIKKYVEENIASKTKYGDATGLVNLISFVVLRHNISFWLTKDENDKTSVGITDTSWERNVKNGVGPFQSFLLISINEIVRDFVLDFEGDGKENRHLINILRFNLLTEPEAELLALINRSQVTHFYINDANEELDGPISTKAYLNLVLSNLYENIRYTYGKNEVKFSRNKNRSALDIKL